MGGNNSTVQMVFMLNRFMNPHSDRTCFIDFVETTLDIFLEPRQKASVGNNVEHEWQS